MKTHEKIILTIAIASLAVLAVTTSVSVSLSVVYFWQESGAWFEAPPGYRVIGGVRFCEEHAYNTNYEVIGFRWKIKGVTAQGYAYYSYLDALPPQSGVWYEWSPFPYGWVEYGGKFRYLAMKYSAYPTEGVWVYAPLEQYTAPTPTPSPPSQPTPTPASPSPTSTPTPTPGYPTPTPSPDYAPPSTLPLLTTSAACIIVAALIAVALTKLKKH